MRYIFDRLPDDVLRKWSEEDEMPLVKHDPKVLADFVGLDYSPGSYNGLLQNNVK
jgi:hypothetical protein